IGQLPRGAGIVRAEEAAVLVFDERVDAARIGARDRDADLADETFGQPGAPRDLSPRLAAVGRFEEAAARSAARHLILDAIGLPQRGEHHVGIPPIDLDVDAARLVVAKQHFLPGPAAVARLEDPALVARLAVAA